MSDTTLNLEGMYKELADGHISGIEEVIKELDANLSENKNEKNLHKDSIKKLKSKITELKKVKVLHKDLSK